MLSGGRCFTTRGDKVGRRRNLANRGRILDGAAGLLREGPYAKLTVDALARRIRMSKSTLYKYFRDKDHLVECLVLEATAPLLDDLSAAPPDDPRDGLRAALSALERWGDRLPPPLLLERTRLPRAARRRVDEALAVATAAIGAQVDRVCAAREGPAAARDEVVAAALAALRERAQGGGCGVVARGMAALSSR